MSEKLLYKEILFQTDPRSIIGSDGEVYHRDDASEFDEDWYYSCNAKELPKMSAEGANNENKSNPKPPEQIKQESLLRAVKIMHEIRQADYAFTVLSDGESSPDWQKYPNKEAASKERDARRGEANKIGKIACQNCKLINSCTFKPVGEDPKLSRIINNAHVTGLIKDFNADIKRGRTKGTACSALVKDKIK